MKAINTLMTLGNSAAKFTSPQRNSTNCCGICAPSPSPRRTANNLFSHSGQRLFPLVYLSVKFAQFWFDLESERTQVSVLGFCSLKSKLAKLENVSFSLPLCLLIYLSLSLPLLLSLLLLLSPCLWPKRMHCTQLYKAVIMRFSN